MNKKLSYTLHIGMSCDFRIVWSNDMISESKRSKQILPFISFVESMSFFLTEGLVEWRIWIWLMDWDIGCLWLFCSSSNTCDVEE